MKLTKRDVDHVFQAVVQAFTDHEQEDEQEMTTSRQQ